MQISAYYWGVRRKPGALVPLEVAICEAAARLSRRGAHEFHGYQLAKAVAEAEEARLLTAYGTLYRALARLETMGLLRSRREDPLIPAREGRPGRRFYTLTALGEAALEKARAEARAKAPARGRRRLAPA
jgi:DNA-binding PadR family transcriptional regulator